MATYFWIDSDSYFVLFVSLAVYYVNDIPCFVWFLIITKFAVEQKLSKLGPVLIRFCQEVVVHSSHFLLWIHSSIEGKGQQAISPPF